MTTEELYEAFRKKYQEDIRSIPRALMSALDQNAVNAYLDKLKRGKPNLAALTDGELCELMSITRDGVATLSAVLLFGLYPQAYLPQLCITAIAVPGTEIGDLGSAGERFIDNKRIEGSIPQMLEDAMQFVRKNMRTKTIIDPLTGRREDRMDYPMTAVREAIVNALVHRDYSMHTEGMPIRLILFEDRMEIRNPGGIYGRICADKLGKVQPDTRNPVLASALEVLGMTENRYSGIPTIRKVMQESGLPQPVFCDERGSFVVTSRKEMPQAARASDPHAAGSLAGALVSFCETPRTREEICTFLDLKSSPYVVKAYVLPLVESGNLRMTIPDKPRSSKQRYVAAEKAR